MKTVYDPDLPIRYPEDPNNTRGAVAAEKVWVGAFPRQWLHNLKDAALEATSVEELRQIVAELIYILLESVAGDALEWPL